MMKKAGCILAFLLLLSLWSAPATALTMEKGSDSPTRTLMDYIKNYVDVPPGATDWKVFGKTKEIDIRGTTKDGYDLEYYKPGFTKEVEALDGKQVTVKGFMFPLDATDAQKNFLFGPFPVSCPFHYHVSPALVLEVHADKHPVTFSYDPVTITGTLQLVKKDPVNSTFYRLLDAHLVRP
ncbi:MAG: DUF3299 domain-containing protein [Alphaproteobacteria bacterium]|nr:DUF3299 domain-containing protein [Alphaproteobacteria bacterium]